jgi:hypothetical protein
MDASAEPAAVSQLSRATGGEVMPDRERQTNNLKTALVLTSLAVAFFLGIMLKYVLLR